MIAAVYARKSTDQHIDDEEKSVTRRSAGEREELMGQLYQRGRIWWVKFYVSGHPVRESTGTDKEAEAKRFLDPPAKGERPAPGFL